MVWMAGLVSPLKGRSSGHEALAALSVLSWPSVRTSRPNIRERLLVIQRHWYGICCCNPFESSRNEEAHKASYPTKRKLSEVRSRHKITSVTKYVRKVFKEELNLTCERGSDKGA